MDDVMLLNLLGLVLLWDSST